MLIANLGTLEPAGCLPSVSLLCIGIPSILAFKPFLCNIPVWRPRRVYLQVNTLTSSFLCKRKDSNTVVQIHFNKRVQGQHNWNVFTCCGPLLPFHSLVSPCHQHLEITCLDNENSFKTNYEIASKS